MHQKGVAHIILFVGLSVVLIGTTYYFVKFLSDNQTPSKISDTREVITESATPSPSTPFSQSPTPQSTKGTPKSTATPKPATPTPQPQAVCSVNVLTDDNNSMALKLAYGVTSYNNSHMTGAQWDFENDGTWDTDMSLSNGMISHTYPSPGNYMIRLQVQMSDGTTTPICSKSATVPNGITIKLSGNIYQDKNCNDMREPDEGGISGVTVNIFKEPESYVYTTVYSNSSGYYEFTKNIGPSDSLTVRPSDVAAYAHKIFHPRHTITLNQGQSTISMNLGEIPAADIGNCF